MFLLFLIYVPVRTFADVPIFSKLLQRSIMREGEEEGGSRRGGEGATAAPFCTSFG